MDDKTKDSQVNLDPNASNSMPGGSILAKNEKGDLVLVGVEQIRNDYICEGAAVKDLATKYGISSVAIELYIKKEKLDELRKIHIKHGLSKLQNIQISNAERLMHLENDFKKLRITQLIESLKDYEEYFIRHGHLNKVHPITGEILRDTSGLPLQLKLPNVAKELADLKDSVSISEGLKQMLMQIDTMINKPKEIAPPKQSKPEPIITRNVEVIDMDKFDNLFKKKSELTED
jgi:hypothetical protein